MRKELGAFEYTLSCLSPYVRLVDEFRGAPQITVGPGYILDHALHYFKVGIGDYTIGSSNYQIQQNRLFFIRPGECFSIRTAAGTAFHMLNIHFDPFEGPESREIQWPYPNNSAGVSSLIDLSHSPFAEYLSVLDLGASGSYEEAFRHLLSFFGSTHSGVCLRQKAAMIDILGLLLLETSQPRHCRLTPYSSCAVQAAIVHLRDHMGEKLSLDELAASAGISQSYLSDAFRRYTGTSPIRYLRKMRIEHARTLLSTTHQPIKQISETVGFHSIHHFSRAFHAVTGLPPAAYRSQQNIPQHERELM